MATPRNETIALSASEAMIATATVTIRALKINNRQLTQATFRQLPVTELIDLEKPELRGIVWGWVNYDPDSQGRGVRQFVAQLGERLFRCPVPLAARSLARHEELWSNTYRRAASAYEDACLGLTFARLFSGLLKWHPGQGTLFRWNGRAGLPGCSCDLDYDALNLLNTLRDPKPTRRRKGEGFPFQYEEVPAETIAAEARTKLLELMAAQYDLGPEWLGENAEQIAAQKYDEIFASVTPYLARWNALFDRLETVEQLFIAT